MRLVGARVQGRVPVEYPDVPFHTMSGNPPLLPISTMATTLAETILARWNKHERDEMMGRSIAIVGGAVLAGLTIGHCIVGARKEIARRELSELLLATDSIAEDLTEVGADVRCRWANRLMMDAEQDAQVQRNVFDQEYDALVNELYTAEGAGGLAPPVEVPPMNAEGGGIPPHVEVQRRGRVEYSGEALEVKRHRKIRHKKLYIQAVVAECKNRFGTPLDTTANHLAVRRFALDRMTAHGVRPTHIFQVLPLVVELVFCHAPHEEAAEQLARLYRFKPWWERLRLWITGPQLDSTMA